MKTGSGRRTIDLDPGTVDVMKLWRIQRSEECAGRKPGEEDLVFTKEDGALIHPDSFSQTFDRKVAKLEAPAIPCLSG